MHKLKQLEIKKLIKELDYIESDFEYNDAKPIKLKKLYRDIVKITHPDITKDKKLNDIYIKATNMYDKNDLGGIYSICSELKIYYDLDESDADNISLRIKTLKDRIDFVESTFTWKWHYSNTPQEKEQVVFFYIRAQLQ